MAPENHSLNTASFTVKVDENGTVTLNDEPVTKETSIENEFKEGSIHITKTDKSTGKPMKDVTFTLKDSTGVVRGTGTTGENGELTFTGLMLGETYTLHEDRVSGYQPGSGQKNRAFRGV